MISTQHRYLEDTTFVEYFNSFLLLPVSRYTVLKVRYMVTFFTQIVGEHVFLRLLSLGIAFL